LGLTLEGTVYFRRWGQDEYQQLALPTPIIDISSDTRLVGADGRFYTLRGVSFALPNETIRFRSSTNSSAAYVALTAIGLVHLFFPHGLGWQEVVLPELAKDLAVAGRSFFVLGLSGLVYQLSHEEPGWTMIPKPTIVREIGGPPMQLLGDNHRYAFPVALGEDGEWYFLRDFLGREGADGRWERIEP
jgi:hypothetical protein